jgi:hypothetical protein
MEIEGLCVAGFFVWIVEDSGGEPKLENPWKFGSMSGETWG